jgi:hypothetical protein
MMSHQVVKVGATLVRPMADRKMSQQSSGDCASSSKKGGEYGVGPL